MVTHAIALVIAFTLLTILQVILGELVPKSLSLRARGKSGGC